MKARLTIAVAPKTNDEWVFSLQLLNVAVASAVCAAIDATL